MDDYSNQPAGDPAAVREADSIVRDKTHPDHKAYWNNNKAVVDKVNALYLKGIPGEFDPASGNNVPEHISRALDDYSLARTGESQLPGVKTAQASPQSGPVKFSGDWDLSESQARAALEKDWSWTPQHMAAISDPANFKAIFGSFVDADPQNRQFLQEFFALNGNNPRLLKLYAHVIQLVRGQTR